MKPVHTSDSADSNKRRAYNNAVALQNRPPQRHENRGGSNPI